MNANDPHMHIELYEDVVGLWRWRLVAANNKIIADSGEGYDSKQSAKRTLVVLFDAFKDIGTMPIVVLEQTDEEILASMVEALPQDHDTSNNTSANVDSVPG